MIDLLDVVYRIEPRESPFFQVDRYNKRRLGQMKRSARARRRRVAKAPFKAAAGRARYHEWHTEQIN